ncbi:adenosine receptor A3-like [Stylophora pistillata]|uniref:adenosine receptor A3-like n=1 Tax=Stylophora pistillata TaxID=50429 RepID=UPI000C03E9CC|nr:adenosine receptor A3-like [Stylophora pistillata]
MFVLFSVYKNRVPPCSVLAAYSIATSFLSGISLLYITIIGLDRYLAIKLHLRYRLLVTEKRVVIMQMALWLINFLLSLVWLKGFRVYSTFAAVVVSVSLLVTFFVYLKVYQVVKRHKVQIQDQMESQMSQFEIFRSKRLRRSAINTLYVFFMFLLCYLPFCVITVLNNISNYSSKTNILAFEFSATLMLSNSSINPVMYCMRLPGFRTAIKKTYRGILC